MFEMETTFEEHKAPFELDIQELEMQDAPGWGSFLGGAAGVVLVTVVYYT